MNINEVKLVLDVLNDSADSFKNKVICFEQLKKHYDSLFDSVEKSDLSNDDKFCLQNILINQESDVSIDIAVLNSKIEAIDVFVAEISQSLIDNDDPCTNVDLKDFKYV